MQRIKLVIVRLIAGGIIGAVLQNAINAFSEKESVSSAAGRIIKLFVLLSVLTGAFFGE